MKGYGLHENWPAPRLFMRAALIAWSFGDSESVNEKQQHYFPRHSYV